MFTKGRRGITCCGRDMPVMAHLDLRRHTIVVGGTRHEAKTCQMHGHQYGRQQAQQSFSGRYHPHLDIPLGLGADVLTLHRGITKK